MSDFTCFMDDPDFIFTAVSDAYGEFSRHASHFLDNATDNDVQPLILGREIAPFIQRLIQKHDIIEVAKDAAEFMQEQNETEAQKAARLPQEK